MRLGGRVFMDSREGGLLVFEVSVLGFFVLIW